MLHLKCSIEFTFMAMLFRTLQHWMLQRQLLIVWHRKHLVVHSGHGYGTYFRYAPWIVGHSLDLFKGLAAEDDARQLVATIERVLAYARHSRPNHYGFKVG